MVSSSAGWPGAGVALAAVRGGQAKAEGAWCAWLDPEGSLYAPGVAEMYPQGFATTVTVAGVAAPMDGIARPTHFAGVATIVAKLLIQATPEPP